MTQEAQNPRPFQESPSPYRPPTASATGGWGLGHPRPRFPGRYPHDSAVEQVRARIDSNGALTWLLTDRLGSVRDVVDNSAQVLDRIDYDGFGNVIAETAPGQGGRIRFTGREYDATTGLYSYRTRYYDPTTGVFVEEDPSGFAAGDANLSRYVGNGPTNATDPSGLAGQPSYFNDYSRYTAENTTAIWAGVTNLFKGAAQTIQDGAHLALQTATLAAYSLGAPVEPHRYNPASPLFIELYAAGDRDADFFMENGYWPHEEDVLRSETSRFSQQAAAESVFNTATFGLKPILEELPPLVMANDAQPLA